MVFTVIFFGVLPSVCFSYSGGSGEPDDPYQIRDVNNLLELAGTTTDYDKCFILTADINLGGQAFTNAIIAPDIDDSAAGFQGTEFTGLFDGWGFTISNVLIDAGQNSYAGLFGYVASDGEIRALGVEDANISGSYGIGALAGYNYGTATDCYATGDVNGDGGGDLDNFTGGLVGHNSGVLNCCCATCQVIGEEYVGGLVGYNDGVLTDCYATGNVAGLDHIGGLAGALGGTATSCYATGDVDGDEEVGGLAGVASGTTTFCYATGNAAGWEKVGGLIGKSNSTITSCYATGNVGRGSSIICGGLVGINWWETIEFCYSTGYVYGVHGGTGGLVAQSDGTVTACFWDKETSGQTNSDGGEGKTTVQMQTKSTFTDAGWDFLGEVINGPNDVWRMCIDGVDYPKLCWEFTKVDFVCPDGVDFIDFAVLANTWLLKDGEVGYNPVCDISIPADETINTLDLHIFVENWLEGD